MTEVAELTRGEDKLILSFVLKHKSIVTAAMSSGGQPNIHCVTHIPEAWVSGLSGRGHCGCGAVQRR